MYKYDLLILNKKEYVILLQKMIFISELNYLIKDFFKFFLNIIQIKKVKNEE